MTTQPPPPPPPPSPPPASGDDGRTLRVVIVVVAVLVVLGIGLAAAAIVGVIQLFGGAAGFTSHIDRANEYLDAARTDPAAAEQMLCRPEAVDPTTERSLAAASGQNLVTFNVTNGSGTVDGTLQLDDGSAVDVRLVTSGPSLPTDAGASEVCIVDVLLDGLG